MKKIIKFILKKIKLRTLIVLVMLLMFNTYAWFLYNTKVKGSLTAHIVSWDLEFVAGEGDTHTKVIFDVGRIYPGMEAYGKTVTANNKGEMPAKLTYKFESVKILDKVDLSVGDTIEENGTTIEVTSQYLEDMVKNNYPFSIEVTINNSELVAETGRGEFIITLTWPFESSNDALDTEWGENAYEFYAVNPGEASIYIELEITAMQNQP